MEIGALETIFPHNNRDFPLLCWFTRGYNGFWSLFFRTFSLLVGASSHDWLEISPFEDVFRTYHGPNFPNLFILLVATNQVFFRNLKL